MLTYHATMRQLETDGMGKLVLKKSIKVCAPLKVLAPCYIILYYKYLYRHGNFTKLTYLMT